MNKVKVIAEAGVNHNGDLLLAKDLIDVAHESGADIVKFQTFSADELVVPTAEQAPYQLQNTKIQESQYDMLKRLELKKEYHYELMDKAHGLGIGFLSTAFDTQSLNFLLHELEFKLLKIPSGEITNASLLLESALSGSNLIISTGMATLEEIENALAVVAFGLKNQSGVSPSAHEFKSAFKSEEGKRLLSKKVSLLHCTTDYPANPKDINLRAMDTLREEFELPVGYSDHSLGFEISIAAVARGAQIIEKHFTLDKSLPGPDHKASLEPYELKTMIDCIRNIEDSLGTKEKKPMLSELSNKKVARKSLYARVDIKQGETIEEHMISIKRPEEGISPMNLWDLIGTKANKNFKKNEALS